MGKERLIELPKLTDQRGNLSFVEAQSHIPFNIARTYWIYDIPGGQKRGSHAFKKQQELIIALSGSFDVELDDGQEKRTYTLNRSYIGLYVPSMTWRTLDNFSTNSVCLVISSENYSEDDYIRDYDHFIQNKDIPYSISPINGEKDMKQIANKELYTVDDCTLVEFPIIKDRRGNLTPIHSSKNIPFDIQRIFYIYDIPGGEIRGMHALRNCHEILTAPSGSYDVELDDGANKKTVTLNSPTYGLYMPPGIWATEKNYSSGAICMVLASEKYDSEGYFDSYDEFLKYRKDGD